MDNENKLYNLIIDWQKQNDSNFVPIPIDGQAHIVFNYKTSILTFIFSNIIKRNQCLRILPNDILSQFQYVQKNITKEGIDEIVYFYLEQNNEEN